MDTVSTMNESAKHETVMDTGAMQLGRVYAQALIAAAMKENAADEVIRQLGEFVDDVIGEHASLSLSLRSPRVSHEEKSRILDALLSDKVHFILLRFLKIAAQRGRLGYLSEMRYAAEELQNEMMGRIVAEVRTAQPLNDDLRQSVRQRLADSLGKEIVLREKVDPDLIGGLVVRVGDTVIDSSVSGRLQALSKKAREGFARRLMSDANSFARDSE
ncbi:MAG: ATP synthase F1 subunit delta [Pirellulaceae bacterium]